MRFCGRSFLGDSSGGTADLPYDFAGLPESLGPASFAFIVTTLKKQPEAIHFFAAGAAHFCSEISIVTHLQDAGYTVTRIEKQWLAIGKSHEALYNLKDDIGETNNLAGKAPENAAELLKILHDWRTEIKAPMPTRNQPNAENPTRKHKQKSK